MKFITMLISLVAVGILVFFGFTISSNLENIDYQQLLGNTTTVTTIVLLISAIVVGVSVLAGVLSYSISSDDYAEKVYSSTTVEEPEEEDDEQQETIISYKCKNCGAPLHFNNGDPLTTCEYCKHQMKRRL